MLRDSVNAFAYGKSGRWRRDAASSLALTVARRRRLDGTRDGCTAQCQHVGACIEDVYATHRGHEAIQIVVTAATDACHTGNWRQTLLIEGLENFAVRRQVELAEVGVGQQ